MPPPSRTPARPRLVVDQMAERRRRILAAARTLVARRGYEALTMRELARASRVTVPTLYNLIGGKEAVLAAAVEEQTARFVAAVAQRAPASPAGRLLAVVEACTRELLALPAYYRSLLLLLYRAEAAGRVRRRIDRALGGELAAALDALAASGELAAWAERPALLRSLRTVLSANALAWAAGGLAGDAFAAAASYDTCLLLAAVTRGAAQRELTNAAREAQARLVRGEAPGRLAATAPARRSERRA